MANHLDRLENQGIKREELEIDDSLLYEQVIVATLDLVPWFLDFAKYTVSDIILEDLIFQQRKKLLNDMIKYFWYEPHYFVCLQIL